MQLPPTILSLNNHKKKKKDSVPTKPTGKKKTAPKATSGPKEKSATPDPPPVQALRDEDHKVNSTDESDEGGDAVMTDDVDIPSLLDETKAETSTSGETNPPVVMALRRGVLEPPRTLEKTLFDRIEKMYGPGIKRLLNVQYRYGRCFLEPPVALTTPDSQDEPEDCGFSVEGHVSQQVAFSQICGVPPAGRPAEYLRGRR